MAPEVPPIMKSFKIFDVPLPELDGEDDPCGLILK
jgi:hypothetical protein